MVRIGFASFLLLTAVTACSSSESSSSIGPGATGGSSGAAAGGAGEAGSAGASGQAGAGLGGAPGEDASSPEAVDAEAPAEGGSIGPYGVCKTPTDCQAGFKCVTVVNEPANGQCTKNCASDADCPASPTGNQVGCHPEAKICLSLCGVHGGQCPDGLECTAQEFCLEHSNVVATKGPGEHCSGSAECLNGAECVEGDNTAAYCAPKCQKDEDCAAAAPGSVGKCASAGTLQFCMFMCGIMANGAKCPGDMVCEGNAVCR